MHLTGHHPESTPTMPAPPGLHPHDRLRMLIDPGSWRPITADESAAPVVAAAGRIDGAPVVAFASNPQLHGGAMSSAGCSVIERAYAVALQDQVPIIGLWHSAGANLREGVASLHAVGRVFAAMTRASGVVPQISVVLGPAAGGAAYGPALTDIVIMAPEGRIFVTGPDVVRSVTGENVDMLRLGGPEPHSRHSGVVDVVAPSFQSATETARKLAVHLGYPRQVRSPSVQDTDLSDALPDSPRRAYDVRLLVARLLDEPGVELRPKWAPNIVTALGQFGGGTVGVVANNPLRLGGCLDGRAAEKAARFVRMCDTFGIPLVVVVDVPGYLPGVAQEWEGIVRRGAKLLHAFAGSVVPRATVVTRKAYGGAYIAMNSRSLGANAVFAWPSAEIDVMGPVAAVRILHRRALAETPEKDRPAVEAELAAAHLEQVGDVHRAVALGIVDEVIPPKQTRSKLAGAIESARSGRGHRDNVPL